MIATRRRFVALRRWRRLGVSATMLRLVFVRLPCLWLIPFTRRYINAAAITSETAEMLVVDRVGRKRDGRLPRLFKRPQAQNKMRLFVRNNGATLLVAYCLRWRLND